MSGATDGAGLAVLLPALIVSAALLLAVFLDAWLSPHARCVREMREAYPRATGYAVESQCLQDGSGGG